MKLKNLLLSLGALGTVFAPIATVISCGGGQNNNSDDSSQVQEENDQESVNDTNSKPTLNSVITKIGTASVTLSNVTLANDKTTKDLVIKEVKKLDSYKDLTNNERTVVDSILVDSKGQIDTTNNKATFSDGTDTLEITISIVTLSSAIAKLGTINTIVLPQGTQLASQNPINAINLIIDEVKKITSYNNLTNVEKTLIDDLLVASKGTIASSPIGATFRDGSDTLKISSLEVASLSGSIQKLANPTVVLPNSTVLKNDKTTKDLVISKIKQLSAYKSLSSYEKTLMDNLLVDTNGKITPASNKADFTIGTDTLEVKTTTPLQKVIALFPKTLKIQGKTIHNVSDTDIQGELFKQESSIRQQLSQPEGVWVSMITSRWTMRSTDVSNNEVTWGSKNQNNTWEEFKITIQP